jgi:hypothetical protein
MLEKNTDETWNRKKQWESHEEIMETKRGKNTWNNHAETNNIKNTPWIKND